MREMVPSRLLATQTEPYATVTASGPFPTAIVCSPWLCGSKRVTVEEDSFAIQSASRP